MANLINLFSPLATSLISSWPKNGLWEFLIGVFFNVIKNYGLTIILFTIALKLILSPLDYINKRVTKKNAVVQAKIQPQMKTLEQKYGHDKNLYNQKVMELYKKENYSIGGSCLTMLVNLVLTLVIFITLWNSLGNISATKIAYQYQELEKTYSQTIESTTGSDEEKILAANSAVKVRYDEIKDGFLWIQNIWQPDTYAKPISSYSEFASTMKKYKISYLPEGMTQEEFKTQYNLVMQPLSDAHSGWNGYFILVVLAAGVTFVSTFVTQKITNGKKKTDEKPANGEVNPADQTKMMTNMMSFLLPILMIWLTWTSSAMFSIYVITNSLVSLFITFIFSLIEKKQIKKETEKDDIVMDYKR